jgi:phosphoglucomutase
MAISPLAGKPAPKEMLVDLLRLEQEYFKCRPDVDDPAQRVSFGTSGHRGSPFRGSFTEAHILAITQAICDYRKTQGTNGPLCMGKDTHALSGPAQGTALEVLAANEVQTIIQRDDGLRQRQSSRTPSWFTTARAGIDSPTALSSPPHTTVPVTRLTTPPAFDEPML